MSKDWGVSVIFEETSTGRLMVPTFCIHSAPVLPNTVEKSADDAADDIGDWLDDGFKHTATSNLTLRKFVVRELGTTSPTRAENVKNLTGDLGTAAGNLPWGVCAIASLQTALATRSGRGRFHFPSPITSSYVASASGWSTSSGYYTACASCLTDMLAGHDVGTVNVTHYSLRVWSRLHGSSRDVTSGVVRTAFGYIRSRATVP